MDHNEAIHSMAVERYLLDELPPELRDAFEEHLFDCPECAMNLRSGAAFVEGAREHLPALVASSPSIGSPSTSVSSNSHKKNWFFNWQAAFAAPIFAALLAIVGYQNLTTIPHLRAVVDEPRLLPWTSIHAGTRGGAAIILNLSHHQGAVLLIDLPQDPGYTSYAFDLLNPEGNVVDQTSTPGSGGSGTAELTYQKPEKGTWEIDVMLDLTTSGQEFTQTIPGVVAYST